MVISPTVCRALRPPMLRGGVIHTSPGRYDSGPFAEMNPTGYDVKLTETVSASSEAVKAQVHSLTFFQSQHSQTMQEF